SALLLTFVIYRVTLNNEAAAQQARFTVYAEEVANTLNARFSRYQAILDASAGLFVSSDGKVDRARWLSFADTIQLKDQYPGIESLDYLAYVSTPQLGAFTAAVRADGAPKFRVETRPGAEFYCPITYIASVSAGNNIE